MKNSNSIIKEQIRRKRLDHHFRRELSTYEKKSNCINRKLDTEQKVTIKKYYSNLGFKNINCRWHEFLYTTTGIFDEKYIPENFYHCVIEPVYTRGSEDLEDKAFMNRFLPNVQMPENIIRHVNGYNIDMNDEIISDSDVKHILDSEQGDLVIKPSRNTGGGYGVKLVDAHTIGDEILHQDSDFVIQRRIEQNQQYSMFNASSVNTEKIISFLFKGKVYILTSILRVGAPGAITDTASTGKGYTVGIQEDGRLNEIGFNVYGDSRTEDAAGRKFSDIKLIGHKKICDTIKKAHMKFPHFGIISWDFSIDKNEKPILIEYNFNYSDVLIYQMNNGPLFGDMTDEVLEDVFNHRRKK